MFVNIRKNVGEILKMQPTVFTQNRALNLKKFVSLHEKTTVCDCLFVFYFL
jgi:hypothetical protein